MVLFSGGEIKAFQALNQYEAVLLCSDAADTVRKKVTSAPNLHLNGWGWDKIRLYAAISVILFNKGLLWNQITVK